MIQVEETEFGIRALDHANVEVAVRASDWQLTGRDVDLDRPTDEVVAGYASELRFSSAYVAAQGQNSGDSFELGSETGPLELPADDYLLVIGTGLNTYIEFTGRATIYKTEDFDELVISFPTTVPLTLGFRSRHEHPVGTITVPPTATGVATALSHLHSSMKTTGPDRSFPTLRGHPPLVRVGDETDVPDAVASNTVDTGIELLVPDDLPSLFVVAPLAYYLQA